MKVFLSAGAIFLPKIASLAKGRLYTTGKVIQRLFIIDLHTQLAIYGYR